MNNVFRNLIFNGIGYNFCCMCCDISVDVVFGVMVDCVYNFFIKFKDINIFYNILFILFWNVSDLYNFGIYIVGYYILGGDFGGDLMVLFGDLIFYFYYVLLDRLWWIW